MRRADQVARRLVRRSEARASVLTRRRALIVAIALELGCEETLLPILLRQLARGRCAQRRPCSVATAREEVGRLREDVRLRRGALAELGGSADASLVFESARRVAELRAAVWLRRANAAGVAASRTQLQAALRRGWPSAALGARAQNLFNSFCDQPLFARRVMQRFRRRFHIAWRRLPARSDVPDALAQQRVLAQKNKKKPFTAKKNVTSGRKKNLFFPRICSSQMLVWNNGRGPKNEPFSVHFLVPFPGEKNNNSRNKMQFLFFPPGDALPQVVPVARLPSSSAGRESVVRQSRRDGSGTARAAPPRMRHAGEQVCAASACGTHQTQ